jgi:hypothetical protein
MKPIGVRSFLEVSWEEASVPARWEKVTAVKVVLILMDEKAVFYRRIWLLNQSGSRRSSFAVKVSISISCHFG